MSERLKWALPSLVISVLAGISAELFFETSFWIVAIITYLAILLNGLIAVREDRGKFND